MARINVSCINESYTSRMVTITSFWHSTSKYVL